MAATDHSRAIISSLFTPNPNVPNQQPPPESFVAYCPTWEDSPPTQPGQPPSRKARFLIVAALRDGRLRLHKAKQNSNGTFSIGKTWPLEQLSQIEVAKRMVEGMPNPQPLEFVLIISGKQYRYKTDMPSSQQAAFLVTVVRCWRRYMNGREAPDLVLLGFAVDNPNSTSTSSSSSQPQRSRTPNAATPTSNNFPPPQEMYPRPGSAASSTAGSRRGVPPPSGPSPPQAAMMMGPSSSSSTMPPPPHLPRSRDVSAQSNYPPFSTSNSSGLPPPAALQPSSGNRRPSSPAAPLRPSTGNSQINASASPSSFPPAGAPPSSVGPPRRPSAGPPPSSMPSSSSAGPPPTSSSSSASHKLDIRAKLDERKRNQQAATAGAQGLQITGPSASTSTSVSARSAARGDDYKPTSPTSASRGELVGGAAEAANAANASSQGAAHGATLTPNSNKKAQDDYVDDETVLINVEEMLEGFEWRGGGEGRRSRTASGDSSYYGSDAGGGRRAGGGAGGGRADEIEKRLIGELKALEAASIHAIMESDDRVDDVVKCLDQTLAELEKIELGIGMYKTQLNLMTDDIAHIEGQNRGLQVQTSNQRQLLAELDKLMSTIHIPESDLSALAQESLESPQGIEQLEKAAVSLYKALVSTRDAAIGDMAAASERVVEYRGSATRFSKRVHDFLSIMFKFQVDQILNPKGSSKTPGGAKSGILINGALPAHDQLEDFLGRYCGVMLFIKEIDFDRYEQICSAYYHVMSDLYRAEIQELLNWMRSEIRKSTEEELDATFSAKESPTLRQQSIRRAGTLVSRSPADGAKKDKEKDGKISASTAFGRALSQIAPLVQREQGFISDFLHVNSLDASITFADYMSLETFFRRGAMQHLNAHYAKMKDIKGSMELVFKFLEGELKDWTDSIMRMDSMQIVGILAALDRFILRSEDERNEFLLRLLQRQYSKSITTLDRLIKEQTKSIEQTKLTLKKRKGVVPFVRVFPNFVARVESQLEGCDDLKIREVIDANYERVTATIFDCLQQMAKMDGEAVGGEGKDQLNYHVILIENMHHIIAVFGKQRRVVALDPFVTRAKEKYNQNLDAYIRLILRRPLARALDFFQGLESLLRTTPPNEVSLHSAYTKGSVRRALGELRSKDVRKAVDGLYKRVDKHFGGDVSHQAAEHSEVLKTVWKATEEEMIKLTVAWKGLLDKCYADDKVGLEFSTGDISEFFKKAQVA